MKNMRTITIVSWLITALVLIGMAIWLLTGTLFGLKTGFTINMPIINIGSFDKLTEPFDEVGSYTVPADDISTISIDWTSGDITITPYDGEVIRFTEYARRDLNDKEKLDYAVSDGRLEINYVSQSFIFNMVTKKIEILVPEKLAGNLEVLKVRSASADLSITDFDVTTLEINETSGDTILTSVSASQATVGSVSGDINIIGMTAQTLTLKTVSGDVDLTNVTADALHAYTTSGDLRLDGTFGSVVSESVSGDVSLISSIVPDTATCKTTSGSITITLPGESVLDVNYSTVSGRFKSEIAVKNSGGGAPYRFSSVSGNITLKAF